MSNPSQVIVLVEGEYHRMLAYRYLIARGVKAHAVRIRESPLGRGSAERWILERSPTETRAYRERQTSAESALIVMIDADKHSVQYRLEQLAQVLKDSHEPPLATSDKIARLIPKRNVETWILCLNDKHTLDEAADYTQERHDWHELIPVAAETLSQWTHSKIEPPAYCVSSLRIGVKELKRLSE
jgi:hypothetical protein